MAGMIVAFIKYERKRIFGKIRAIVIKEFYV